MLDSPNLDIYLNATLEPIEIPAFPYTLRQKALGRRTSPSNAKSLLCLVDGHTLPAALITSVTMGRATRYWSAPSKHKLSHPNAASWRHRHISIWRKLAVSLLSPTVRFRKLTFKYNELGTTSRNCTEDLCIMMKGISLSALDSIALMDRNGLFWLFFAPGIRYRLNFTVTEWQQEGQLAGPDLFFAGLSLGKFLFEPRKQLFDNTTEFAGGCPDQGTFHGIPSLRSLI